MLADPAYSGDPASVKIFSGTCYGSSISPVPPPSDTLPPSTPVNLSATAVSSTQINLVWSASTDNTGVTGYKVYRGGTQIATVTGTSYSNVGLTPSTPYSYTVAAYDAAGNTSAQSPAASATTQAGTVTPPSSTGILAAYAFNEGSGSVAADKSGKNNTGTLTNAAWASGTNCKFDSCLSFNGINSYLNIPDSDSLSPGTNLTISADVKLSSYPSGTEAAIVSKWSNNIEDEYLFHILPSGQLSFAWHTTGGDTWPSVPYNGVNSVGTIPLNTLTHVAVVRSGATVTFYINGVQNSTFTVADANPFRNGNTPLRIGAQVTGATRYLNGTIDEVRIEGAARTQAEIQSEMNTAIAAAASTPPPPPSPTPVPPPAPTPVPPPSTSGTTLFTTQTPAGSTSDGPSTNYELGTRFTSVSAGNITAIRFYKSASESGTHTGRIWSSAGTELASVTFTNETASGWQEQALQTPLAIAANTPYTVTVNTGNTYYVYNNSGLASQITNGSLSSVVGSNGVYGPVGSYPTNTYQASNYFRDVRFTTGQTLQAPPLTPLTIGSRITTTANLNVRASASAVASKLGTQLIGSQGIVTSGPTTANGYTWWNINYDTGADGWSIAPYLAPTVAATEVGMIPQSSVASLQDEINQILAQIKSLMGVMTASVGSAR
jgi:chitodextrinase